VNIQINVLIIQRTTCLRFPAPVLSKPVDPNFEPSQDRLRNLQRTFSYKDTEFPAYTFC